MFHLYMKFQHSLDWVMIKNLSDFLHWTAFAASILENKTCIAHFGANNSSVLRKSALCFKYIKHPLYCIFKLLCSDNK